MRRREFLLRTLGGMLGALSMACFGLERLNASPYDHKVEGEGCALALASVLGIRESSQKGSRLVTQVPMGTPLSVLSTGDATQVMAPDGTIGWVDASGILRMAPEDMRRWNSGSQVISLSTSCYVYEKARRTSRRLTGLVYGSRLRLLDTRGRYYEVSLPDGRRGFLGLEDGKPVDLWREELRNNPTNIVRSARELLGVPFLEGGALPGGLDSDGLICLVMAMHDAIIPRKAASMAQKGERMDVEEDFGNLLLGDLIYFGEKDATGARIHDVGMFSGQGRVIICLEDGVREVSLVAGEADYDPALRSRMLHASRILPYIDVEVGLSTSGKNRMYQEDFQ